MSFAAHSSGESTLRRYLIVLVAPLLVVLVGWSFEVYMNREAQHQLRISTVSQLATLRARLEGVMSRNINLVQGLTTVVVANPDITQQELNSLGDTFFQQPSQLRNIALARDMVISHVYPLRGNEKALGLNYRTHPQQSAAAKRVVDTGAMVLAGPVELVQGGIGFVARVPVYTVEPKRFWGLTASVIDAEEVYEVSGLREMAEELEIALRGKDSLGADGEVFFGRSALFDQDVVMHDIALPSGSWQMAARPKTGWATQNSGVWQIRLRAGLVSIGALVLSKVRVANTAALAMRQLREEEIVGHSLYELQKNSPAFHPDGSYFHSSDLPLAQALTEGKHSRNVEIVQRLGEPDEMWVMANAAPVHDESGNLIAAFTVFSDVTEKKRAEAQIRHHAYFDALTGLPNRTYFIELLDQAVRQAHRRRCSAALPFLDLDRFKNVDDTLGHDIGDLLLKEVAARLRDNLRATDTVARLGGDEFTIILTDLDLDAHVTVIAEKLIYQLSQPHYLEGHEIVSGASIGITLCPEDGNPHVLLKNADMAMYQAKEKGRNTFRYFTAEMTERAELFVTIEKDLRGALVARELHVEYQPVIHLASRKFAGLEALVRWTHREKGRIGPNHFIPVAEETGQIVEIGECVLQRACEEVTELSKATGHSLSRLSINVSSRQFWGGFSARVMERILSSTSYPAERLILEITESLLMDEDEKIRKTLFELRELGVGLSVDDFGTGFSALGYLRRFPATVLKIDKSFIADLGKEARDTNLVAAIIAMAHSLELHVVAEGVETPEQAQMLEQLKCDYLQGYLLGRPMALPDLEKYVKEYESEGLPLVEPQET